MTELDMSHEELMAWHDRVYEKLAIHHSSTGEEFFILGRFVDDYITLQELVNS